MSVECPTCGGEFKNRRAVSVHHVQAHDRSIAGFEKECPKCGTQFTSRNSDQKYCSDTCKHSALGDHNRKGRVEIACEVCGSSFKVYPCRADTARFCSVDCRGAGCGGAEPMERDERSCDNCGEPFDTLPTDTGPNRFCSWRCYKEYHQAQRVKWSCKSCESTEVLPPGEAERRSFCSTQCLTDWLRGRTGKDHPRYSGGMFPYGPGWNERKKEKVRERDNRECQDCGFSEEEHLGKYGEKLHVHHLTKAREVDSPEERNSVENLIALCRGCHLGKWEPMYPLQPQTAD